MFGWVRLLQRVKGENYINPIFLPHIMRFAIVDSNYLANKDLVEKTLKSQRYDVTNSKFDIYALNGKWGRFVLAMNPNITFRDGSVDELAENIINGGYSAVFVSLDKPNIYKVHCNLLEKLRTNELYTLYKGNVSKSR